MLDRLDDRPIEFGRFANHLDPYLLAAGNRLIADHARQPAPLSN
jgi:hypothetical protein